MYWGLIRNTWFCCQKHGWKFPDSSSENIQLRHAYRCLQKDSLVSHLLADNSTTIPSPSRYDSCVAYMLYKYDMTCFVEISFLYVGL